MPFQTAPRPPNRFRRDPTFRRTLERLLPPEIFAEAAPALDRLAERATEELPRLAAAAEATPPRHVPYAPWGERIDRIEPSPAFDRLVAIGQEEGLVALPEEDPFGVHTRVVQAAMISLFEPVSAVASCPLTMSDGVAWLLRRHDPALAERYGPRLTARAGAWTAGQWMTETAGGSDVSRTETVAVPRGDGSFALHGRKWFTSATSADIAVALARPEGSEAGSAGLSLFLLELRGPDGGWNGIEVRRLKEKMGTRALPTAELDLLGTVAVPVGGIGRGVAKVASVLNIARLWAALAGPASTGHLLGLARDYAGKREVFGRRLADQPVHLGWLAEIAAEYEGMTALVFETAAALGRAEHGGNAPLARLLTPLAKLACARQGIRCTSELLESFGGAGYVEDTGIPAVFRNVHVNAIWEGTTNVLAHDVRRALQSAALAEAWLEDVERRLAGLTAAPLGPVAARIAPALETLRPMVLAPPETEARRMALGMARVTQAALLAEAAQWRLARHGEMAGVAAAELFTRAPLLAPPQAGIDIGSLALGREAATS